MVVDFTSYSFADVFNIMDFGVEIKTKLHFVHWFYEQFS